MPRVDQRLIPVLTDLSLGLRAMEVPFAVVGALVLELLLDEPPARMTNDADVAVAVPSLQAFEGIKEQLAAHGFEPTASPHRMRHRGGAFVDLLPCGDVVTHGQRLRLADGVELNMAGFARVIPSAVSVTIGEGLTLPVARLPLWSLLKLVAYSDRRAPKDLAAVFHALQHYLEDDDRRYLAEHAGVGVPFEYTCAYLLGADATPFLDDPVRQAVATVLGTFDGPDAQAVTTVAMERGRGMVEDREREQISEHFRWYRLGAGI